MWSRTRRTIVTGRNEDSARILESGFKVEAEGKHLNKNVNTNFTFLFVQNMSSLWNPWRKRWLTAELFGKLVYLLFSKRLKWLKEKSNGNWRNYILLRPNFGRGASGSIFTMYKRLTIYDARGVRVGAWTGVICSSLILQQPWDSHVFNISIYSQVD